MVLYTIFYLISRHYVIERLQNINDNLVYALKHNPNLKTIVRSLDMYRFINDKDAMRFNLGKYPIYLYDDHIFNDVNYIFNRNVIFDRLYPMMRENDSDDFQGGITSFDDYCYLMRAFEGMFGIKTLCPDGIAFQHSSEPIHLTDDEKKIVIENIQQNITSLAEEYPNVTFYYFFTSFSAVWRMSLVDNGTIYKQLEAE